MSQSESQSSYFVAGVANVTNARLQYKAVAIWIETLLLNVADTTCIKL